MKIIAVLGGAAILGGGLWMHNPYTAPNLYPLTPDQAYARLKAANTEDRAGPFGSRGAEVSGVPGKTVVWGNAGGPLCTAIIAAEGADKSRLDVTCPVRGEAAAAGLMTAMRRNETIELIDSTLKGRTPDYARAGATAAGWPKDVVHHGNIGEAVGQAIEMDAQMQRDLAEMERDEKKRSGR